MESNQPRLPWQAPMIPVYVGEQDRVMISAVREAKLLSQWMELQEPALVRIRQGQLEVKWMKMFINYLEGRQEEIPPKWKKEDAFNYCMQCGVLCKLISNQAFNVKHKVLRPVIVVPNSLRSQLSQEVHDSSEASHEGVAETYHVL
jgi:hypothetical protein